MKTTIYLFTILLALNACKSKKEVVAKETPKKEEVAKEMTDAEREAAIMEQMKNEKPPSEGKDYYQMVEGEIPTDAVSRIQRTACFGRCPIYTITIFKDGHAEYFGKRFAPREGLWVAENASEIQERITAFAREIGYFDMDNVYDNESVTDVPSTITSVRTEEGLKTVVNRFDAPEELNRFEKFIDAQFSDVEWFPVTKD